ncbi:MAG: tyrosine-protein phosphatase [Phycisphaerae bacterium]|nr:tyrosine-protein phosphatase [Phycisphaerae bacterium]
MKGLVVGAAVVGVSVAGILALYYKHVYIKHFRVVQDGVLYRSGQPDSDDLVRLRDAYGIRTIVNLRRTDEQNDDEGLSLKEERDIANRLGIHFYHLPMDGDMKVDPNTVRKWLEIARAKENHPLLVHCKAGSDRTGLLVAIYRIEVQRWPPLQALNEAMHERMDVKDKPHLKDYVLDNYARSQ